MNWMTVALITAGWAVILIIAGGLLTDAGQWYRNLKKPGWQPPDWLFAPAWTIVLGLSAWSFYIGWTNTPYVYDWTVMLVLFAVNFGLHFLWSPLFFKIKRPDWALIEIALLWLSVLSLCVFLSSFSTFGALLNLPYLLWVSFAALLNWEIVRLNRPFGGKSAAS